MQVWFFVSCPENTSHPDEDQNHSTNCPTCNMLSQYQPAQTNSDHWIYIGVCHDQVRRQHPQRSYESCECYHRSENYQVSPGKECLTNRMRNRFSDENRCNQQRDRSGKMLETGTYFRGKLDGLATLQQTSATPQHGRDKDDNN